MRALAILTVKNEGPFLAEWFAHHRTIGFTDFLVFSNDCDDGTDAMLDRLAEMGWITHLPNPGPHPKGTQFQALARAESHPLLARADWVGVLDIDEFVNIHAGDRTLGALLALLPQADAVALTWRMFGNAGVLGFEDRPVTRQFTRAAPAVMGWPWRAAMFKTLYRNDGSWAKPGVHRPRAPLAGRKPRWFDGSGRELPDNFRRGAMFSPYGRDNYRLAQLNHYALGSLESYLVKCDRGRVNRKSSTLDLDYWVERNLNEVEDGSILLADARAAPLRAALTEDAEFAALHRGAVAWRRRRVAELLAGQEWRDLAMRLLMAGASRVLTGAETAMLAGHARASQVPVKAPLP